MNLKEISKLRDNRINCYSIVVELTVSDYLELAKEIYKNKGGLDAQREPLKSSSAMRIRKQMVKDIKAGTVLPPIVLGVIISQTDFDRIETINQADLANIISLAKSSNLTIIDGMQRTTALLEAIEQGAENKSIIRVEFWISTRLNSLIYRMLVLNTGQVPWNLRRQVETVFSSMINEMKQAIPKMEVYTIDEKNRRSQGGQYHADDLIELYLVFGARKEKVDTKERLADEFTRLDFIDATEKDNFADTFYKSLSFLTSLDIEFSRFQSGLNDARFNNGHDLFKSQPARVGLITAIAKRIYGRPGVDKKIEEINENMTVISKSFEDLLTHVESFDSQRLEQFLALNTLSEKLAVKTSRVGDFEREYFTKAFDILLEENVAELLTMEVCWQAY